MVLNRDVAIRAPRKRIWDTFIDHQFGQCGLGWKRVKRFYSEKTIEATS